MGVGRGLAGVVEVERSGHGQPVVVGLGGQGVGVGDERLAQAEERLGDAADRLRVLPGQAVLVVGVQPQDGLEGAELDPAVVEVGRIGARWAGGGPRKLPMSSLT